MEKICTLVMKSEENMYNPLCCKPEHFVVNERFPYMIRRKGTTDSAIFYLTGLVQKVDVSPQGSTVNIAPEETMWPRIISFIGSVMNSDAVYVPSYENGLSMGTRRSVSGKSSKVPVNRNNVLEPEDKGNILKKIFGKKRHG